MNKRSRRKNLHLISSLALVFGVLSPLPASASVVEDCAGVDCTVTFAFSGQMQTFTPPQNAKNMTFEVAGAQGGKSGGGGGQVTGALKEVPEVLYVFVGGAGKTGNSAPGGFNGGGTAGSGSDMEGSGGGASDIRTGLELFSRIVVAGGGGARGAGLGSGGGSGGGLVALNGRTAQGFGGAGGSQDSGGVGGAPNGSGGAGLEGSLGVGGTGGSSELYGGGGGGGGYFGGGGGGSDTDPCCTDAGGGGGGSSYANEALVLNAVHSQGVWPGSGQVVLRYQLAPTVSFISQSVSGDTVNFQIEFDQSVSGFEISDLEINHSSGLCSGSSLSGSGQSYQAQLSGCGDGEVSIAIKPDAVTSSDVTGPVNRFSSSTVLIDTILPSASFGEVSASGSTLEFTEIIQTLDLSALELSAASDSCTLSGVSQQTATTWQVTTTGCELSDFTLRLLALSVSDASGNLGPELVVSTSFTAEVPEQPAPEQPAPEFDAEQMPEPVSEPAPIEQPQEPEAGQPEPEVVQEIAPTPVVPEIVDAPAESVGDPQQDTASGIEQTPSNTADLVEPVLAPEVSQRGESPAEDLERESEAAGIFTSPPATSLPQASQAVTIPAQSLQTGFRPGGLTLGLFTLGLFALVAGLIIARRGIPGVLSS